MNQQYPILLKNLGLQPYLPVWHDMQNYTEQRNSKSADQIWLLQHEPVFTQGQAGKPEHIFNTGNIPVVQTDRGGQVTYHGPGQLIVYFMLDIKRRGLGVRQLVTAIESAVINCLADYGISSRARPDAPGVYVEDAKIASLGLRIRRGCSYHGLAFNIAMNTDPFACINPCGMANLAITQLSQLVPDITIEQVSQPLIEAILEQISNKE